jgi:hypothetical protein
MGQDSDSYRSRSITKPDLPFLARVKLNALARDKRGKLDLNDTSLNRNSVHSHDGLTVYQNRISTGILELRLQIHCAAKLRFGR